MTIVSFRPIADLGKLVDPNPHFDDWDPTAHAYFTIDLSQVRLGDVVFGGTHQVDGIGRAEQRGVGAVRLDLVYLAGPSVEGTARAILPVDHKLEIKRYGELNAYTFAWLKLEGYEPGLVPDYHDLSDFCCDNVGDVNEHGFETSETICDKCIESWEIDYDVVRHLRS